MTCKVCGYPGHRRLVSKWWELASGTMEALCFHCMEWARLFGLAVEDV